MHFLTLAQTACAVTLAAGLAVPALPALAQETSSVTIALGVNVNTLDPHKTASVGSDLSVLSHIYPALLLRGPDMKLTPDVAKSWKQVNDLTWTFDLVDNAVFSDGEKIDADAVKWNLDRVRDPKVNARIKAWFNLVKEVKVLSPTKLEVDMSAPYPAFANQLSMFLLLPPKWAADHDPAKETLSGGPYTMTENVPGDHITLKANPKWWGDKPDYGTVTFRVIPETASRVAALMAGEVDLVTGIPVTEFKRINASANAKAGTVPSTRSAFIKFNTLKPPFDNKTFRQALNYAVDKQGIVDAIFGGQAKVSTCQILTPDYFGYNPDLKPYPYDPDKAAALLKQSGVDLSQPIQMDVPTGVYLQGSEVAQAVADQLTQLGLNIKITEMDFGTYMNKYQKTMTLAPLSLLTQAWPTLDADGLLTLFAPGNSYAYWNDAEFGKALDQGRSTTDEAARLGFYKQATARMCEEAPALFLYVQPTTYGVSKKVAWQARGDDWVRAFDMKPAN
jgi:peptide/nickel transport system substrate-binding protein